MSADDQERQMRMTEAEVKIREILVGLKLQEVLALMAGLGALAIMTTATDSEEDFKNSVHYFRMFFDTTLQGQNTEQMGPLH